LDEGRNLAIEYRWAQSRVERYNEIAAEFVRLNVDAIVTNGTAPVIALKQATSKIPVIFAAAGDPIGNKLVTSLSRPGANITGLSIQQPDTAGKRLELLREVIPNLQSLAVIANVDTPGYRTQDLDFRAELERASAGGATNLMPVVRSVSGLLERPDGNNVSMEREGLLLAETQMQFGLGVQLLRHEFQQLLMAINEGSKG